MARPDYTQVWASERPGGIAAIPGANYRQGWQFRSGVPPLTINFDYYQNLTDLRIQWLSQQLPMGETSDFFKALAISNSPTDWRALLGTGNASNLTGGQIMPALLPNSGVTAGTYGNSTTVPRLMIDVKGRVVGAEYIPISYPSVPAANEFVQGTTAEATQAEVNAGSNVPKFVNPFKLLRGFAVSMGNPGYIRLPDWAQNWTFQWGGATWGANQSSFVSMPTAFQTICLTGWVNINSTSTDGSGSVFTSVSGTNLRVTNPENSPRAFFWYAIGR